MKTRQIKINNINLQDKRFRFTLGQPEAKLLRSIQLSGVVVPVKIIKRGSSLVLVSGWKRVEGALSCGQKEVPALELPEEASDLQAFSQAFYENYGSRQFSLAEKSLAVKKFLEFGLGKEEIICEILPFLELPPTGHTLEVLLKIASLDAGLSEIHEKDWKLATAELYLQFSPEEKKLIISLISGLSHNKQREIIESFYILKKRKNKNISSIVAEPTFASCLELFNKNKIEAADKLLAILRKEVNPLVSRLIEEIDRESKQLQLPANVWLKYDRTLEKNKLFLEIEISSSEQLKETLAELIQIQNKENWQRIFSLLESEQE